MSALHPHAVIVPGQDASRSVLAARRPERVDTLVAFALLAMLLAGWMLNFAIVKQLTLGLGSYLVPAPARQV
jgi:hypothetical protein